MLKFLIENGIYNKKDARYEIKIVYPILAKKTQYSTNDYEYIDAYIQKINDDGSFKCASSLTLEFDENVKIGSFITAVKVTNGDILHYCLKEKYLEMLLLIGQKLIENGKHEPNDWKRFQKLKNVYEQIL